MKKWIVSLLLLQLLCAHAHNTDSGKAICDMQQRIAMEPSNTCAYLDYIDLLCSLHKFSDAVAIAQESMLHICTERSISARQALQLIGLGQIDEAIQCYERMLVQNPHNREILYNIAYGHKIKGNMQEACALLEKIIALDPTYEKAQFSYGHTLLQAGEFERGWAQHDRFLIMNNRYSPQLKEWIQNNTLKDKKIVLRQEGGFGDTLQFLRFAQLLHESGAFVIAHVPKALMKLLSYCSYLDCIVCNKDPMPAHDAFTTFMTLPALYNVTEKTMPTKPYLFSDPALEAFWAPDFSDAPNDFKIGICWAADEKNDVSRLPVAHRGIPLSAFLPLANLPGIRLYSLQKYNGTEQIQEVTELQLHIFDHFDESHGSFVDSAAIMKNLDLVISVDTSIAHMAGALQVPVFLLLPYFSDWRWIVHHDDSPWYPTMRIFKQTTPFDWQEVVQRVVTELKKQIV